MITIKEIAEHICGVIFREESIDAKETIGSSASLKTGEKGQIGFLFQDRFLNQAKHTRCSVIVTKKPLPEESSFHGVQILHPDPQKAWRKIYPLLYPRPTYVSGISEKASIHPGAKVHHTAVIGPYCVIEDEAEIGPESVLLPYVYVGQKAKIGANCMLHPRVTLMKEAILGNRVTVHSGAVLGAEGFGFHPDEQGYLQWIPQIGLLIIEDDVHIGANTTIDRGTFDSTVIQKGTKIDAQVHIGHNVTVGEHSILCGQVGIAGSATLGKRCIAAGQVGISQGVTLTDGVILGASCGVMVDVKNPGEYLGTPATSAMEWKRELVLQKKLKHLLKEFDILKKKLDL